MRSLGDVLDKLMEIPTLPQSLKEDLAKIRISAAYAAPEMQNLMWNRAAETLSDYDEGTWSEQAIAVFNGIE